MATVTLFDALPVQLWGGQHDYTSHTFKAAFYPSGTAMSAADATPSYTDYGGELTGGNIPAGGVTLDSFTVTQTSVDFADEVIAANSSNPSAVRRILIYNDTTPLKSAVGFVDFGTDLDLAPGGTIVPASGGFITQSA